LVRKTVSLSSNHILGLPTSPSSASRDAIVAPVVRQGTIPLLRYIRRGLSLILINEPCAALNLLSGLVFRMPRNTEGLAMK